MKNLLLLLVFVFLTNCSKDDEDVCTCNKETYQFGQFTNTEYYSDDCDDEGLVLANVNNVKMKVSCK